MTTTAILIAAVAAAIGFVLAYFFTPRVVAWVRKRREDRAAVQVVSLDEILKDPRTHG